MAAEKIRLTAAEKELESWHVKLAGNDSALRAAKARADADAKEIANCEQLVRKLETELASLRGGLDLLDLSALPETVKRLEREIEALNKKRQNLELKPGDKQVVALTLDGFVGRTGFGGFRSDWVLVDEAACAHLAKTLPLLSLGSPIAMFGDHRQLPPVVQADEGDALINAYWGRS
ncbi:MAG: hypothetical protein HY897_21555 [Deltaproteobacteria bacterium]|nr:hypothetical protein [Deltaproteobacteria bacterium]